MRLNYLLFTVLMLLLGEKISTAQCINTFPFTEDFEVNNGNWIPSGSNSDWTWGHPSKLLINAAGSGQNCWITGGLSNPVYNGGEKSFLVSPCFDFTTLTSPYISFKIFWDTEKYYDGGNFQYSSDGGISWQNVGAFNASSSCSSNNWFNDAGIFNLSGIASPPEGWSGNTHTGGGSGCREGGGLGKWVLASNCMQYLAGEPNVIFRFTFCSGTSCNTYDGIAIDSLFIGEAPAQTADFNFICDQGNKITVNATASACVGLYDWDFGDAGSPSNTGTLQTETHQYNTAGTFTIRLRVAFDCAPDVQIRKDVTIINATVATYPVTCKDGADGAAAITITGSSNSVINWNVNPPQSADSISAIKVGNYNVTVVDPNGCSFTKTFSIVYGPDAFVRPDLGADTRLCPGTVILLNPGTFITYLWNDGSVLPEKNIETVGTFSVIVSNQAGCIAEDSVIIKEGCGDNVWMPTAFSPNNDTKNDVVFASGIAIEKFAMTILNRWGQTVFVTENIALGWDGTYLEKPAQEGIYGYTLHYTLFDGKSYDKDGTILLIR